MARSVQAPDGRRWLVGRDWPTHFKAPRLKLPKRKGRDDGVALWDLPTDLVGGFDDILGFVGIVIFAIVLTVVLAVVGAPLILFAAEALIFVVATAWGLIVRQIGRRPWTIRARSADGSEEVTFKAVGWRASGRLASEVARRLRAGEPAARIAFPATPHCTPQ